MPITTRSEVIRTVKRYLAQLAANGTVSRSELMVVEEFAATYQRILLNFCERSAIKRVGIRRDDQIADLVQNVWSAVLRQLPKFEYDRSRGGFRRWLYVILRRQATETMDIARRRGDVEGQPISSLFMNNAVDRKCETPLETLERRFREEVRDEALRGLKKEATPREWYVFMRCALEGAAPRDVAAELGVTATNVRNALATARRKLKRILAELTGESDPFAF